MQYSSSQVIRQKRNLNEMKRIAVPAVAVIGSLSLVARWRPITAITAPDQGNPNTTAERAWVPLANAANGPSYLDAHATFSQVAATPSE
jgi:hypothetical protein